MALPVQPMRACLCRGSSAAEGRRCHPLRHRLHCLGGGALTFALGQTIAMRDHSSSRERNATQIGDVALETRVAECCRGSRQVTPHADESITVEQYFEAECTSVDPARPGPL